MDYAFQSARIGDIRGGLGNFDASTLYRVLFQKIPKADIPSKNKQIEAILLEKVPKILTNMLLIITITDPPKP